MTSTSSMNHMFENSINKSLMTSSMDRKEVIARVKSYIDWKEGKTEHDVWQRAWRLNNAAEFMIDYGFDPFEEK